MAKATPQSKVGAQRAQLFKQTFANPIKGLTPARLIQYLDAFNRGELRQAVLLWQQILERDDQVRPCYGKRQRAVTSLNWEILPVDDSKEAEAHKEALEHFYNNLTAVDGLNLMERGGVRHLIRQMMSAVPLRYAMHEIVWQPAAPGGLTAEFKFLPLQFFENTTGKLRYLKADHDLYGADLDEHFGPGGWMCASGDGLMVASSIAYLFKVPAGLKAWVSFMEKFGMPPLHASTSAGKDTAEWDELKDALEGYGEDLALVTSEGTKIEALELKNGGQAPHPQLVERMDRAISRIWMGGDLATMSATGPSGTGSNPQSDDLVKLQEDDAAMITDTLQHYVDKQVVRQLFGDVAPLAYFKLSPPARMDVDRERATDEFLISMGVPVGKKQLMARYNRTEPADTEELAQAPAAAPSLFAPAVRAANERPADTFRTEALKDLSEAQAKTLRPLVQRIEAILALPDDKVDDAIARLKADMVNIQGDILRDPAVAQAFEKILGTAFVQGATTAREKILPPKK